VGGGRGGFRKSKPLRGSPPANRFVRGKTRGKKKRVGNKTAGKVTGGSAKKKTRKKEKGKKRKGAQNPDRCRTKVSYSSWKNARICGAGAGLKERTSLVCDKQTTARKWRRTPLTARGTAPWISKNALEKVKGE